LKHANADLEGHTLSMWQIPESNLGQGTLKRSALTDGICILRVTAADESGQTAKDGIRLVLGTAACQSPERYSRGQDNAVGASPERGLLNTPLGPSKNGGKW